MRDYLKKPLNSTDIDFCSKQKKDYNNDKIYKTEKDFVFIHKTHYMPKSDQIKSKYSIGVMLEDYSYLFDKRFDYKYLFGDNYLHFALNCEVKGDTTDIYGFNNRKYAVIIPGCEEIFRNIHYFHANDIEFEDTLDIRKGYILCPFAKLEEVKANNPKAKVIPYLGEYVDGYAEAFACQLGYTIENIEGSECMWKNSDYKRTNEVLDKYNFHFIPFGMDRWICEHKRQSIIKRISLFKKVLEIALDENINIFHIFDNVEEILFRGMLNALDFDYKIDCSKIKDSQIREFYENTFGENCTNDENILIKTIISTVPFEKVQEDFKIYSDEKRF